MFIGTFLDKINESSETIEEKNRKLLDIFSSEYLDPGQFVFHDDALNHLIFAINARNPGKNEAEIAKQIRACIQSAQPPKINVPIWWYVLDISLDNLTHCLDRKVLSKKECLEVARKLNFAEDELIAALNFLHDKHLLHYYPHILPDVVFASPQVLLDKLTELVKEAYRLRSPSVRSSQSQVLIARTGGWRLFRNEGIITLTFLQQKQFQSHFVEGIFSPPTS